MAIERSSRMRPVLLAATTVVSLLGPPAPLPAAPSPWSQATCASRSYEWIDRVTKKGRQAILWKCKGGPYYHAQITGAKEGDRIRVFALNPTTNARRSSTAYADADGRTNTYALKLVNKEQA